uniref:CSON007390 protein n=1 Tax=Culicoides sonorensis TaxID=179676 RepID=A0A336LN06_CULSO
MLKSSISDTTVRIVPSQKLIKYLKNEVKHESILPENIQKIIGKTKSKDISIESEIAPIKFNQNEIEALQELNKKSILREDESKDKSDEIHSGIENITDSDPDGEKQVKDIPVEPEVTEKKTPDTRQFLVSSDLKWLFNFLQERRKINGDTPYLNELLEGSDVILPENEYLERNPVLEERCRKLRKEQEQREYEKMTKNVDSVRKRNPDDSIGYQIRVINSQLIAILQFVFSVAAGFAFGFIGIALIVGDLDFGFRLLLGIMFALIIALAEIYFLAKKLNEDYDVKPEAPKYNDYGEGVTTKTKKDN